MSRPLDQRIFWGEGRQKVGTLREPTGARKKTGTFRDLNKDNSRPLDQRRLEEIFGAAREETEERRQKVGTLREPTGARKKTGTLRAAREETEERRQKPGTLREPNTPETVPQELLSKDFSDFWKWRSSREVKRGPKGITKPKVLLQPQRPAYGPPNKFYMSDEPSYYDYHFLDKFLKEKRRERRAEENRISEFIARQKALSLQKGEKKKSSAVKAYSVLFTESANSANGQKRQNRTSGSNKFAEYTKQETVAYSPVEHHEDLTEAEKNAEDEDEQEEEDEEEELTQEDMLEIEREETDKYMRQKVDHLLKYDPMHIIRRRQDNMINDRDDHRIRALTRRRILAKQEEIAKRREMEKKRKQERAERKKERVVYRSSYHGPIYLESLSYETNTSDSEEEDENEEETSISEAEETEEETEGENESATDNESEEHPTEDVSATESEASDRTSEDSEPTDYNTSGESSEISAEEISSAPEESVTEASEASASEATEASEASEVSEASASDYES